MNRREKGITLIALVITIIILLILAGISIVALTGNNGLLTKATKTKEEHLISQYKEEINLIIAEEVTERKTESKEEPMIVSLEEKIKEKEWVQKEKVKQYNEEEITEIQPEKNKYLIVESKEGYEFIIEIDNKKETAKIAQANRTLGEKYMITYDPNEGKGEKRTVEVRSGFYKILEKNTFTKTDYIFGGWCEDKSGKGEKYLEGSKYQPKRDVILYAIWEKNPLAKDVLKVNFTATEEKDKSPYVKYNNLDCRVLYNDNTHGLQLITAESVEQITLGYSDPMVTTSDFTYNGKATIDDNFKKAAASYNNAVDNLNNKAKSYMDANGVAIDARCLGSIPILNRNSRFQGDTSKMEIGYGWSGYMVTYGWGSKFKTTDDNYKEDINQIDGLGLNMSFGRVWLASRIAFIGNSPTGSSTYYLFLKTQDPNANKERLFFVHYSGATNSWNPEGELRPVFLISPEATISYGDGSSEIPYVIE